eukprot:284047_1
MEQSRNLLPPVCVRRCHLVAASPAHSHALPSCWQHHCFLKGGHPAFQLEYPAAQPCGGQTLVVATGGGGGGAHPLPPWAQHQLFLPSDQPATQLENPALQSYGRDVTAG